jgi:hypothetical protein
VERQNVQMTTESSIGSTARQTLDSVVGTVNNNKLLIGSIAGACGTAIFLWGTDSGRRIRSGIQTRAVDLYDYVTDQLSTGFDQMRDLTQNMLSGRESEVEHRTTKSRRVA